MKQEETWEKTMSETTEAGSCERSGDLVTYLYGEANEAEALAFRNHLNACTACRTELSTFGEVREGILTWRSEALNPMTTGMSATKAAIERTAIRLTTRRSAVTALREFFTLSPLWLQGATAMAVLLFVGLLIVTGLRFFGHNESLNVRQAPSTSPSNEEKTTIPTDNRDTVVQVPQDRPIPNDALTRPLTVDKRKTALHASSTPKPSAPVLSNEERSQLRDLLIAERKEDEEGVPRLYDLLSESN